MPPVFVGGTGRSGTTATARLLGKHSSLALVPAELRIHLAHKGLLELLEEPRYLDHFVEAMRTKWFRRSRDESEGEVGLFELVPREVVEQALAPFPERFAAHPDQAAAQLIRDLLDPIALRQGRQGWIEHSPENVKVASTLHRLFPDLKFVHSVRDGRDVGSSITTMSWGPHSLPTAIRWWGRRMREAHLATRDLPSERLLVLQFEDLVDRDRNGTLARLLEFVGLSEQPEIRKLFDERIVADRANLTRWHQGLTEEDRRAGNRLYEGVLESLRRDGAPLPVDADTFDMLSDRDLEHEVAAQHAYELRANLAEVRADRQHILERLFFVEAKLDSTAELLYAARDQRDHARERNTQIQERLDQISKQLNEGHQ